MSTDWRIPDVREHEHMKPPPVWVAVVALIVAFVVGFIITILNWKQGESIISARFFSFALGVPFLVWGAFCGMLYLPSEDWNNRVNYWNYLCRDNFSNWRSWTQWNLCILDTVTLTPEVELAERMLGLDGSAPTNAGAVMSLQGGDAVAAATGLEDILAQLVTPLAGTLQRFTSKRTIHIALQTNQEAHLTVLRNVLQTLDIAHEHIAVSRFEPKDIPGILDEWINNQKVRYEYGRQRKMTPDLCLMLACQINDGERARWLPKRRSRFCSRHGKCSEIPSSSSRRGCSGQCRRPRTNCPRRSRR